MLNGFTFERRKILYTVLYLGVKFYFILNVPYTSSMQSSPLAPASLGSPSHQFVYEDNEAPEVSQENCPEDRLTKDRLMETNCINANIFVLP